MAISNGSVLKRPKVVEESLDSDSDDSQSESGEEQEVEPGDVEIKEEVEDDYLENSNLEGESFTAYSNDEDFTEIKEEEDEAESSEIEDKKEHGRKKRKKEMKNKKADPDSDSDDVGEDESEEDEGNFSEDESIKEEEDEEDGETVGSGLANVMAKILGTKRSEDVILSKAKMDREVKKKTKQEDTFEIVDSSGKVKKEPMVEKIKEEEEEEKKPIVSLHDRELHRKLWEEKFRKRPSITEDREKERKLRVLATQGVVQLFSAIEKHRTMMQVKLSQCRSIMGREKVLESTGKEAFLDILKRQGKRVKDEMDPEGNKVKEEDDQLKEEVKDEPVDLQAPVKKKPKWNVLSDNFYKEPTLHGWDQQSDDEDD